jgi:DNA-binding transcriptional MerR regulator
MEAFPKVYRIGEAARRVGLTPHTIRVYEREGAITFRRDTAGVRMLSDDDLRRIREIRLEREARRFGR